MKKIFALLLVVAMLATAFVACNDTTENSDAESTAASTASVAGDVSAEQSEEPKEDVCWLPEKKWNTELIWASGYTEGNTEDIHYFEIMCEEDLGDTISKTVLNRTRWLEDTYGITIEMIWNPQGGTVQYAETAANSDMPLDVICGSAYNIGSSLQNGYFYDIAEINTQFNDGKGWLDLSADYWDQNAIRDYSFANRVFMLTGDILLYDDEATWAIFFNKDLVAEYGIEDPYKTVRDGNWTVDYLYDLAREYTKADGDKLTWDADANHTWTIITQAVDSLYFMLGCCQNMITKDSDDLPVMRIDEQRNIDVAQKVMTMMLDKNAVGVADDYGAWNSGVYNVEKQIFSNGHAMFMPQQMAVLNDPNMKEATFDIGVLPMPKADDLQDEYSSTPNVYWFQMLAIPVTNVDRLEATLYALEAMSWYGNRYVKPEYYEKVLKLQKFRDENAEEMLDMIFNNRTYDMGIAYSWGDMIQFYNYVKGTRTPDIVSTYEKYQSSFQTAIDNAIATFTK